MGIDKSVATEVAMTIATSNQSMYASLHKAFLRNIVSS